jgi:D-inositol-3-phosphate glycosyltransferase
MVNEPASARNVGMGILFYPRGGSAQVVRYLSRALEAAGWGTCIATGSLGDATEASHGPSFYGRDDLVLADFTEARQCFLEGRDPLEAPVPFHPSYEDRPEVPDRSFARVSPELAEHQAESWRLRLSHHPWAASAVAHLHHLTPMHDAIDPAQPLLTHLHGTELKFVERARRGLEAGPHATWWADRFVEAARRAHLVVCISDHDRELAIALLGLDAGDVVVIPNGVDVERFVPQALAPAQRLACWRRWLVEDPQGWDSSGRPGSVRYTDGDLAPFGSAEQPNSVLLFVGRFLEFKRVPQLIRAYARARPHFARPTPLVIWGGAPGEWEGEHPVEVAVGAGVADSVFFVGWRGHDELPLGLAAADVFVGPSVDEPFGQVFLEAMATGRPPIATASGGPLAFVRPDGPAANGWLVGPDDEPALAEALVEAASDADGRQARGVAARRLVEQRYSWQPIAWSFIGAYEEVLHRASPTR